MEQEYKNLNQPKLAEMELKVLPLSKLFLLLDYMDVTGFVPCKWTTDITSLSLSDTSATSETTASTVSTASEATVS